LQERPQSLVQRKGARNREFSGTSKKSTVDFHFNSELLVTMNSTISLRQYRTLYPCVSSTPTLTERGLIGPMLHRVEEKSARKVQRREMRRRIFSAILHPLDALANF